MNERSIFIAALEKDDPVERSALLDEACGTDALLRQRVEKLLRAHAEAGGILDQPPVAPADPLDAAHATTMAPQPSAETAGTRIGPYKLLQQIGEGGMGTVWMAEQSEPVRRMVALKIIKLGMDSSQVVARFEAERQALAIMDHPNIAKVLEAGTTESGRPYFVMELVRGTPITQYCDQHRLSLRQRLELFVSVCQALQHAHQKAIIHRDIKPSNVLVAPYDGRPVVKVIDFGVAKAMGQRLTERTMFTEFGAIVGTLQYMSPEQAELNNQDIDTRSDIYSLGVLLYELLTGTTPLDMNRMRGAALAAVLIAINEEEPPKPSTRLSSSKESLPSVAAQRQTEPAKLSKLIRGELDWIVMKALDKDRMRRYETASALARDIELYLQDEPVTACPPSASYRLRKFARKHRAAITMAVGLATVLVIATAVSVWQAYRALRATRVLLEVDRERTSLLQKTKDESDRAIAAEQQVRLQLQEATRQRERAQRAEAEAKAGQDRAVAAEEAATKQSERAEEMTVEALHTLGQSAFHNARAVLASNQPGRRWAALDAIRMASTLQRLTINDLPSPDQEDAERWKDKMAFGALITNAELTTGSKPTIAQLRSEAVAALLQPDGRVIHEFTTVAHAVSPDGKVAAVQLIDFEQRSNRTKLIEISNGEPLGEWTGQSEPAIGPVLALGPEGKLMARGGVGTATKLAEIAIVELPSGRPIRVLKQPEVKKSDASATERRMGRLNYTAFSPDGNYFAGVDFWPGDTRVILWDLKQDQAEGRIVAAIKNPNMTASFSADSRLLAWCADDKKVVLWNLAKASVEREITLELRPMGPLGFSPDGKLLAVFCMFGKAADEASDADSYDELRSAVVFCNLADGREVARIDVGKVTSLAPIAYSPDGQRIAVGESRGIVRVYELNGGAATVLLDHLSMVQQLAWDHSGRRLVSGSPGALKVWEFAEDIPVANHALDKKLRPFGQFTFSPDGRWFAMKTGLRHEITLLNRDTNVPVHTFQTRAAPGIERSSLCFSPDSRILAFCDSGFAAWDVETGEQRFQSTTGELNARGLGSIGFGHDGNVFVAGRSDRQPVVWNAASGELLWGGAATGPFHTASVSRDAQRVAAYASMSFPGQPENKHSVVVLNLADQREMYRIDRSIDISAANPAPVNHRVEFSPDGRWIASIEDHTIRFGITVTMAGSNSWNMAVYDAETGNERFQVGSPSAFISHTFSPDGQYLAIALRDGMVQVWNVVSAEHLFDWRAWPPTAQLPFAFGLMSNRELSFTSDGKSLAILDADQNALKLLDMSHLNQQLTKLGLGW